RRSMITDQNSKAAVSPPPRVENTGAMRSDCLIRLALLRSFAFAAWRSPMTNDTTPAAARAPVATHNPVVVAAKLLPELQSFLNLVAAADPARSAGTLHDGFMTKLESCCGTGIGLSASRSLCASVSRSLYLRHV